MPRRCPCGKQPSFNVPGKKPICCSECKTDFMIDVKNKSCPCGKQPRRESIRVEKDGEIISALPLITPPDPLHSPVRRRLAPISHPAPTTPADNFSGLFSIARPPPTNYFLGLSSTARPPPQEARQEATRAAAAYLEEVDARQAATRGTTNDRALELVRLAELAARPAAAEAEEKTCVICYEELAAGQRLAATNCGHVFCVGCISMSLIHSDACPTCRTEQPIVTVLYI